MISAQEVRIGNLLRFKDQILPVSTTTIERLVFPGMPKHHGFAEKYEPIPLTEEWLVKLGLVPDEHNRLFSLPQHIRDKCKPDMGHKASSFFFNDREDLKRWMDCQTRVCVDYVHQVQNLVFALTGQELEVLTHG